MFNQAVTATSTYIYIYSFTKTLAGSFQEDTIRVLLLPSDQAGVALCEAAVCGRVSKRKCWLTCHQSWSPLLRAGRYFLGILVNIPLQVTPNHRAL